MPSNWRSWRFPSFASTLAVIAAAVLWRLILGSQPAADFGAEAVGWLSPATAVLVLIATIVSSQFGLHRLEAPSGPPPLARVLLPRMSRGGWLLTVGLFLLAAGGLTVVVAGATCKPGLIGIDFCGLIPLIGGAGSLVFAAPVILGGWALLGGSRWVYGAAVVSAALACLAAALVAGVGLGLIVSPESSFPLIVLGVGGVVGYIALVRRLMVDRRDDAVAR